MLKFKKEKDEELLKKELELLKVPIEEYVIKRRKLEVGLVDAERSRLQKQNWREKRWKYLKGIRKFHRSTKGKKFHRALGRFLATREFEGSLKNYQSERDSARKVDRGDRVGEWFEKVNLMGIEECREFLIGASSTLTHALIELRYYEPSMDESVGYKVFLSYLIDRYLDSLMKIVEGRVNEVDWGFWEELLFFKEDDVKEANNS